MIVKKNNFNMFFCKFNNKNFLFLVVYTLLIFIYFGINFLYILIILITFNNITNKTNSFYLENCLIMLLI